MIDYVTDMTVIKVKDTEILKLMSEGKRRQADQDRPGGGQSKPRSKREARLGPNSRDWQTRGTSGRSSLLPSMPPGVKGSKEGRIQK